MKSFDSIAVSSKEFRPDIWPSQRPMEWFPVVHSPMGKETMF
jgi:hypothetical protein